MFLGREPEDAEFWVHAGCWWGAAANVDPISWVSVTDKGLSVQDRLDTFTIVVEGRKEQCADSGQ